MSRATGEVVERQGDVVGAEFGCQARQETPEGARTWEFESKLRVQAAEGRLDRVAESVEPAHRARLVSAWRVVAGQQHRCAQVIAPMLSPARAAKALIGQARISAHLSGTPPPTQWATRAAACATQAVTRAEHGCQIIGAGGWRVGLAAPAEQRLSQPVLLGAGRTDDPTADEADRIDRRQNFDAVVLLSVTSAMPEVSLHAKTAAAMAPTAAHQRHGDTVDDLIRTHQADLVFDRRADPGAQLREHAVQLTRSAIERALAQQVGKIAPPVLGRPGHELALRSARLPLAQHAQGQHFAVTQLAWAARQAGAYRPSVLAVQVVYQAIHCHQEGVHIGTRCRLFGFARPPGSTRCGHLPGSPTSTISASSVPGGRGRACAGEGAYWY